MCPKKAALKCAKTGVFGGLFGEIRVKNGWFLAKKSGEKTLFLRADCEFDGRRGYFGPESDIMS
jgi:hypothetical protein